MTSKSRSNRISINIRAECFFYFRRTTRRFLCLLYPHIMVNTWFRKAEDEFTHLFLLNANDNILEYFSLYYSYLISLQNKILLVERILLKGFQILPSDLMPIYPQADVILVPLVVQWQLYSVSWTSLVVLLFSLTVQSETIFWPKIMTEPFPNMLSQIKVCKLQKDSTNSESKNVKTGHETHQSTLGHRHWKWDHFRGTSANQFSTYLILHLLISHGGTCISS